MKILAVDIGATNIRFGIYNAGLSDVYIAPTPKNKKEFLKKLAEIALSYKGFIGGIAICLPGMVDSTTGEILNLPNLKFLNGVNIKKHLAKFSKNIRIDNDAKCYLRAEAKSGSAKGKKNVLLAAVGTGIGGAIMIDGKIYYGQGAAGEIGHIVLENQKTLEMLAAGRTATKHRAEDFKRVGKYLGIGFASLINVLNPEVIVLTGGFGQQQAKHFLKETKQGLSKYVIYPKAKSTPIVLGKLGAEAAMIGAALLFS